METRKDPIEITFDTKIVITPYLLLDELHGLDWVTPLMLHHIMSFLKFWGGIDEQQDSP